MVQYTVERLFFVVQTVHAVLLANVRKNVGLNFPKS